MKSIFPKRLKLSTFQIIILGFIGVIVLGALLLMLPVSTKAGVVTPFNEAIFTSTSAVCVTGLVVHDTASYWSAFGHVLILIMIQIGGLGVVTVTASLALIAGKKIGLMQRSTMQEAVAAPEVGGIVKLTLFILKSTAVFEGAGAIALMPVYCRDLGFKGVWYAVFHSVSAFCNAGFDLLGTDAEPYQSFTSYCNNPLLNIAIMLLIIFGGLGFMTWKDIRTSGFRFRKYRLQSKIILVTSAILIFIPAILFFFTDFADLSIGNRILAALFQSVTTRTAGFNTVDLTKMNSQNTAVMIVLMLVGGSPGSTAGGMKTTTLAVLFLNMFASIQRKDSAEAFGRRIDTSVIKNALTILTLYVSLSLTGAVIISIADKVPFGSSLFETVSAISTIGLTLGLTPGLSPVSHITLMLLMFFGRVGGLTLIYAALSGSSGNAANLPLEKITVG